jgi:hypothetical protein
MTHAQLTQQTFFRVENQRCLFKLFKTCDLYLSRYLVFIRLSDSRLPPEALCARHGAAGGGRRGRRGEEGRRVGVRGRQLVVWHAFGMGGLAMYSTLSHYFLNCPLNYNCSENISMLSLLIIMSCCVVCVRISLVCAQIVYSDFVIGEDGSGRPWDEWVASSRLRAP